MTIDTVIPLTAALGAFFVAGGAWFQLKAIQKQIDRVEKRLESSATSQGKRIGDLESWQYAVERENKAVRRTKRELEDRSRGVVTRVEDDSEETT